MRHIAGVLTADTDERAAIQTAIAPVKWNWLDKGGVTLSNSLLTVAGGGASWPGVRCTKFLDGDGAWYWEVLIDTGAANTMLGIAPSTLALATDFVGQTATSYAYYASDGNKYTNNAGVAYGASYTTGDVIGVAFKVAAGSGSLWFRKNGTWQNSGDPAAGTGAAFTGIAANAWFPTYSANGSSTVTLRALASSFSGSIPTGFIALS